MKKYDWSKELDGIFSQVRQIKNDVETNLRAIYDRKGLPWDEQVMRNLSGDIHTKVLGVFVGKTLKEEGADANLSYEKTIPPTRLRADIVINGRITIESKAQGIFDLKKLQQRWQKLSAKRPDMVHILVSWNHNSSYVKKIREFILESQHYYFHNLSTHKNQPHELQRLIEYLKEGLKR